MYYSLEMAQSQMLGVQILSRKFPGVTLSIPNPENLLLNQATVPEQIKMICFKHKID
jgi:hypothetical protein